MNDHFEQFKIRLVARDFTQQFEVDYENIFVSVICFKSLQVLLTIVTREKMLIHMMNVQNAYLNFNLNKKIYMKVSKDVENTDSNSVCLLLKSIYNLKQSANL